MQRIRGRRQTLLAQRMVDVQKSSKSGRVEGRKCTVRVGLGRCGIVGRLKDTIGVQVLIAEVRPPVAPSKHEQCSITAQYYAKTNNSRLASGFRYVLLGFKICAASHKHHFHFGVHYSV